MARLRCSAHSNIACNAATVSAVTKTRSRRGDLNDCCARVGKSEGETATYITGMG